MANGYYITLDSINPQFDSPSFSLYSHSGTLLDQGILIGKDVGKFFGSYIHVTSVDHSNSKIDLLKEDAVKITFGTGWNFFSIPIEDGNGKGTGAIMESTCNEATIWGFNLDAKDYEKVGILKEGEELKVTKGFWVKIQTKTGFSSDEDCSILVSGKQSSALTGKKLKMGWNAIGAPMSSITTLYFDDINGDCIITKGPWQYLPFVPSNEVADSNKFSKPQDNKVRLNRGYFIEVANDCELS